MTEGPLSIVTGAASGIGREIALRSAKAGSTVIVADLDRAGGEATVGAIQRSGGVAYSHPVDMGDPVAIRALIVDSVAKYGPLSVLVNNAAVTSGIDFFDVAVEDWDLFFDVNARGSFFAMKYAAEEMRSTGGGSIVNMASIAGKGWSGTSNVAYASTKGAVIAMTRVAAAQLGSFGIRVNAVCPGVTDTGLLRRVLEARAQGGGPSIADQMGALEMLSSLRRVNSPSDVAAAVLFLASAAAAGITGQSINVDSGVLWD